MIQRMSTKHRRGGFRITKKQIALAVAGTAAVAATVGTLYAIFRKRKSLKDMMTPRLRKFTPAQRKVFLKESRNRNLPGNTAYDVVQKADEAVQRAQRSRKMQNQYRKRTLKRCGRKGSTSRFNFRKVGTVVLGVLAAFAVAGGTAHAFMSKSPAPSSPAVSSRGVPSRGVPSPASPSSISFLKSKNNSAKKTRKITNDMWYIHPKHGLQPTDYGYQKGFMQQQESGLCEAVPPGIGRGFVQKGVLMWPKNSKIVQKSGEKRIVSSPGAFPPYHASSPSPASPSPASSPAASSPNAFHRPQIYKYPGIGEKQGPKAMLHKMLDIWENKGPRSTIGNTEWKSIYDTIPANIQRKIIPDGRYGRTGFISHTLKWLFNSEYLKGFIQAKNQVIEPDLWSLQEPPEGYVLYATIYNTGAHYIAYFINTTELQNRHVFEFNALHSSNPQSKIINTDTSDSFSERFDISMEKTRFNDCILNRQPADVITKNGENGCHINTLWYVLTGFPELRKYIKQQTGYV